MCDRYRNQLEREFGDKVGPVELSLLEKAVFIWMGNWIERNLRKEVASYRQVHSLNFELCMKDQFLYRVTSWYVLVKWHQN